MCPSVAPGTNPWDLESACMFAMTVFTTIGYGSFAAQVGRWGRSVGRSVGRPFYY
jgi:hypothetical protein